MAAVRRAPATVHLATLGLIVLITSGCSSWQAIQVREPGPEPAPISQSVKTSDLKLRKRDGHKLTLRDWTLEGDTLRGTREQWVDYAPARMPEVIALNDVMLENGKLKGENLRRFLRSSQDRVAAKRDKVAAEKRPMARSRELPDEIRVRAWDGKSFTLEHPTMDADSLRGVLIATGAGSRPAVKVAIALKDVRAIETRQSEVGKTLGLTVVAAAVALFGFYILGASQMR